MVIGGFTISDLKFPQITAHSLELALQSWFDWTDSLRMAREQLGWKDEFSIEEWEGWSRGLDRDIVWEKALKKSDELKLPRLFAGYWIACLVSRYDPENIYTFSSIEYPDWVLERFDALQGTLLQQKPPFGHGASSSIITGQGLPDRFSRRALPPSYIGFSLPESASFVTFHIPLFTLPGIIFQPSPLIELIKEIVEEYGQHDVSVLLKGVGKSAGGEWERSKVKQASEEQLRPLYKYLLQSEYYDEVLKQSTEDDIEKAIKSLPAGTSDELLVADRLEAKLSASKRKKLKGRVRKRVSGWFKKEGRWPLPPA